MMKIYVIFAYVGWAWALLVGLVLLIGWWSRRRAERAREFDVVQSRVGSASADRVLAAPKKSVR